MLLLLSEEPVEVPPEAGSSTMLAGDGKLLSHVIARRHSLIIVSAGVSWDSVRSQY